MLLYNGTQMGANSLIGRSTAESRFLNLLCRWARVRHEVHRNSCSRCFSFRAISKPARSSSFSRALPCSITKSSDSHSVAYQRRRVLHSKANQSLVKGSASFSEAIRSSERVDPKVQAKGYKSSQTEGDSQNVHSLRRHEGDGHESAQSLSVSTPPLREELSNDLRSLMRTMPHSVVVLTTSDSTPPPAPSPPPSPRPPSPEHQYRGITLSSFTTVTLTPEPIISFNIRRPSRTLSALKTSKHCLIHLLKAESSGKEVAHRFTQPNTGTEGPFTGLDVTDLQSNGDQKASADGLALPRINHRGIHSVLTCEILKDGGFVEVGDHVLVLGKVCSISPQGLPVVSGLMYHGGEYRAIGPILP